MPLDQTDRGRGRLLHAHAAPALNTIPPTERLVFLTLEERHRRALAAGKAELARLLAVAIPDSWPEFPEAFAPAPEDVVPRRTQWDGYLFIAPARSALVGNGGFHGPPNDLGEVEIGYEIAAEFRNNGYATEAVRGFVEFAFSDAAVRSVIAHTLAEKNPSNSVLARAGFRCVAELPNEEVGRVWRWALSR
jgi:RimJ/RimL family protein N-acetyltransferase